MSHNDASASDTEPPGLSGEAGAELTAREGLASLGYIDCLQYCLERRGEYCPKAMLMGISGESFRLCYDRNDPERGLQVVFHNPMRAACATLGYECEVSSRRKLERAVEALLEDLAARGCAVLHSRVGWVVVQSDPSNGARVLARLADGRFQAWPLDYLQQVWLREPGLLELGLQGYYYFMVGDKEREPDEREAAMAALRRGVRLLSRKSRVDGCAAGLAAYQELPDSLLRKRRDEAQQAHTMRKYAVWNARPLTYVTDSRRSAVQYLTLIQPHFGEEAHEHLRKAAEGYQKAAEALAQVPMIDRVPDPPGARTRLDRAERRTLRSYASVRRKVASSIRRARRAEEEALLEIQRALEAAEKAEDE